MRTLLIGIDGATFHVIDSLIDQGIMPFLGEFCRRGTRSTLRTIIPALTPPAWTSLMTGRPPGHHGVFDFFRLESPESRQIRFATSHDVGCETIWSLASRHGKRVFTLNFPLMYPAPEINGCVIPGWVPWKLLRFACYPSNLFDRLKEVSGLNPRELAMDIKLEEKATEGCRDDEYDDWIRLHIRREENWLRAFRYLMDQEPFDFGAILFDGVDKLQHLCWRFIDPDLAGNLNDWEKRIRDLCLDYFRRLDQILEELCQYVDSDGQTYIASDHGFGPTQDLFHINTWLEKNRYLKWADTGSGGHDTQPALLGVGQVARHTYLMDWDKTRAFATTPT
ncbi:MAG TPA: alkaline phosphatase family protein, partial [Acidobacteriota bacterium]|nr:alkaline phosphatase family protein [Acidobacteriota bacterium]